MKKYWVRYMVIIINAPLIGLILLTILSQLMHNLLLLDSGLPIFMLVTFVLAILGCALHYVLVASKDRLTTAKPQAITPAQRRTRTYCLTGMSVTGLANIFFSFYVEAQMSGGMRGILFVTPFVVGIGAVIGLGLASVVNYSAVRIAPRR